MSLFEYSPREVNVFEPEREPCIDIDEFRELMNAILRQVNMTYGKCRYPPVMRMGGWMLERWRFVDAVRAWTALQRRSAEAPPGQLNIRATVRSAIGYASYAFTLFLRYLLFYMARTDIGLLRNCGIEVEQGVLFFPFKVIFAGRYEGRHPFSFQVEVTTMAPAFYVQDERLCIDTAYLINLGRAVIDCLSQASESEFDMSMLETILDNAEVQGIEWVKTHAWWGYEITDEMRGIAVAIEKRNDYGGYETYNYYAFGIRPVFPGLSCEQFRWFVPGLTAGWRTIREGERPLVLLQSNIPIEPTIPTGFTTTTLYKSSGFRYLLKQATRRWTQLAMEGSSLSCYELMDLRNKGFPVVIPPPCQQVLAQAKPVKR